MCHGPLVYSAVEFRFVHVVNNDETRCLSPQQQFIKDSRSCSIAGMQYVKKNQITPRLVHPAKVIQPIQPIGGDFVSR